MRAPAGFNRFSLLDALLPVYGELLAHLKALGVAWVRMDEPILGLDLPDAWRHSFEQTYWQLARSAPTREFHIVGGLHPKLSVSYYTDIIRKLREAYPGVHVKALTAVEIAHLARIEKTTVRDVLLRLKDAGLTSMPGGGAVTVRALPEERHGQIWARIEVRDEGDGISAETAERIFEPFFTTKATGTGLGLAVVKRIIDAHHGEVTVQARPLGGTTFTVRLPGGTMLEDVGDDRDDGEDTLPPSTAA